MLDKSGVTDEGLGDLAPLAALKRLSLRGTRVTLAGICGLAAPRTELDIAFSQGSLTEGVMVLYRNTRNDDLAAVARLKQLKALKLNDSAVDDAGLAHLSKMFNLEQLVLPRTITDKGLVHLSRLSGLKQLAALGQAITGEGLRSLESLTSLEEISVDGTQVDDIGLAHISRLGNLQRLSCRRTRITDALSLIHISEPTRPY